MEAKKGQIIKIYNGHILTPTQDLGIGSIFIADGKIIGVEKGNYEIADCLEYNAQGNYIALDL